MDDTLHIAVISGTTRENNQTQHVAKFVHSVGQDIEGIEVKLLELKDFSFPKDGNWGDAQDPEFTKFAIKADAFFIVTPEYNHSFPGSLKRALDSVRTKHYVHKPVATAGVSNGMWGGLRVIEHIQPVYRELGLMTTFVDVQFPKAQDLFNEDGSPKDEKYIERVQRSYTELIWVGRAMKDAIAKYPNKYHEESED